MHVKVSQVQNTTNTDETEKNVRAGRQTVYIPGINTSEIDLRKNFGCMRALDKGLHLHEFNGRLTFVTDTHVDDLFYACDTECKTTKALLVAIVIQFNMSRKQDDCVFVADVFV